MSSISFSCFDDDMKHDLYAFYDGIVGSCYDNIVFIDGRTHALVSLIADSRHESLLDSGKTFMTEHSFLEWCRDAISGYKESMLFPSVMICADIFVHGRAVNSLLVKFEKIFRDMTGLSDIPDDVIYRFHFYACYKSDMPVLLMGKYQTGLKYIKKTDGRVWHAAMDRIVRFISGNGLTCTESCLEHIDSDAFERVLNSDDFACRSYMNEQGYYSVRKFELDDGLSIFLITCVKPDSSHDKYSVIPFVLYSGSLDNIMNFLSDIDYDEFIFMLQVKALDDFNSKYGISSCSFDTDMASAHFGRAAAVKIIESSRSCSFNDLLCNEERMSLDDIPDSNTANQIDGYCYDLAVSSEESAIRMSAQYYTSKKALSCINIHFISELLSNDAESLIHVVQMIDNNTINIINDNMQSFSVGCQAFLSRVIDAYAFMPMLELMYRKCVQWGLDIDGELDGFALSEYCHDMTKDECFMLESFCHDFKRAGQEPSEWCGNFLYRLPESLVANDIKLHPRSIVIQRQYGTLAGYMQFVSVRGL